MEVTVSIPDKFVAVSASGGTVSREMLEAYAIENYRQEKMSLGQVAELLGFSIGETDELAQTSLRLPPDDIMDEYRRRDKDRKSDG